MGKLPRSGTVAVTSDASPEEVWRLLADVTRAGEWSHETRGGEWLDGATAPAPGVRFRGRNGKGMTRWSRVCEIVTAESPRELAWRTVPTRLYPDSTLWRYEIEPIEGGSRITQRFDIQHISPLADRLFYLLIPAHRDRTPALEDDLRNLGQVAARSSRVETPD